MKLFAFFIIVVFVFMTGVVPTDSSASNSGLSTATQTTDLSVMTYNIRAGINMAPDVPTLQNLEFIAQIIENDKPDILFLQEVMRFDSLASNIDEFVWMKERLDYPFGRFASGAKDPVEPGTAEWGVAIYLNTGYIVSSEKYRLGKNRVLLRVTASINNSPVELFCTHLGSGEIPSQAEMIAEEILAYYLPLEEPIILGGDFNAKPGASSLSQISAILDNIFEGSEEQPIDSFFISSDVEAFNPRVIPDPTEASDHDPVAALLRVPLYSRDLIMEENFDVPEDINKLNKSPWWAQFGGAGYCRYDNMGGEAVSYPNVLYIMKDIYSNGGEQFQWLPRKPSPSEPLRFTWHMKHNHNHIAKGSVIASNSSSYQNAIVSWYDPDPASTKYGIRCYNTFETGGAWSPETISFNAPKYPKWNQFELLCMGTRQEIYVNDILVGTWGPATNPDYDRFNLWQWGRCNSYENHNPEGEGLMWIDDVSIKVEPVELKPATFLLMY